MSNLLRPFSWLYGFIVWIRNWCYDVGLFKIERVTVPVISVGNMTAGGTGKTPFVEYLVRYCSSKGKRVAVLSRGYKRNSQGTIAVGSGEVYRGNADSLGDELFQIARKFPNATVIADEKRIRSAKLAVKKYQAEVILLDDGFQHRSLGRNLDIVMVSGSTPLENIPLLPAGLRREPMSGLKRANVIVESGTTVQSLSDFDSIMKIKTEVKVKHLKQVFRNGLFEPKEMQGKTVIAVSGIANPERFHSTLESLGLNVRESLRFSDHHRFSIDDLKKIQSSSEKEQTEYIITTEKDAVRLLGMKEAETMFHERLLYVEIEMEIRQGKTEFHTMLDSIIGVH
ncbi:MAG: tetraacyldisaccharide 4'-kinase [Ignavibacteriae bacterium]|nr:tetraacyldisaccharide 4'-kinase [Ignavibacteriota bacterium]